MTPYMRMRIANKGKGEFRAEGNTLWLYDVIAADDDEAEWWGGISPRQFMATLASIEGPVLMRINSPGGSVFGAQAMVAAMRAHGQPITARVDSLAASAASVIACEAATLEMVPGSMMMIHKAWGLAIGNEDDMRSTADLLGKLDGQIAATYSRRSEGDPEEWMAMMKAETWFDADEAVAAKLADRVIDANTQRANAKWDLSAFAAAPWQPRETAPEEQPPAPVADESRARRIRMAALRAKAI